MKYILLLIISGSVFALPDYKDPEILARSSLIDADHMPVASLFVDATPTITNDRRVGIPLSVIEGQEVSGIWTSFKGESRVPYYRVDNFRISNFEFYKDSFLFTVYNEYFYEDLILGSAIGNEYKFDSLKLSFPLEKIKKVTLLSNGYSVFGAIENKLIGKVYSDRLEIIEEENKNNISYLFAPSFNHLGQVVYKVRLGKTGELNEERPDQIRLKTLANKVKLIAVDKDYDVNSKWISLRNSVSINDSGHICFFAVDTEGKTHLILFKNGTYHTIAIEGEDDIAALDYFSAVLNNKGLIAFRAHDISGNASVFISDGHKSKKIFSQNSIIHTRHENFLVSYGPHIPFGGNIAMNDLGDIVINTGLASEDGKRDRGRSLVIIYSKE